MIRELGWSSRACSIPEHVCKIKDRKSPKQAKCKYWNPKKRKSVLQKQTWKGMTMNSMSHVLHYPYPNLKPKISIQILATRIQPSIDFCHPNPAWLGFWVFITQTHLNTIFWHRPFLSSSFFVLCTRFMFYNSNKLSMIYYKRDAFLIAPPPTYYYL